VPGESILVVDDSEASLKLARVLLQHAGFEVRTAADAEEALRALSTFKPRLILTDIRLPGMDGLDLVRRLRADMATRDIVILGLSASVSKADEEAALAAGCDGYVTKPIDVGTLSKVIAGYLSGRPAASSSSPGKPASTAPVLLVEDNAVTRKMMRLALAAEGYSVIEAADGQTALHLVAEQEPAMVLLDCKLPDMDGFEVARRIHALAPSLPVVAVTGWAHADEARVLTAGFLDVLLKPVDSSRLVEIVARYAWPATPHASSVGRVVLLVDDDAMQRKLGQIALTHAGFEVLLAEDGEAGICLAAERKPDVIVSDVLMPRVDGFGVCKAIRADPALAQIRIVLMSAQYVEAEDRQLAKRFGADRYVSRTTGFASVVQAVVEALASPVRPESVPPPSDELQATYLRRITHQLERQASLSAGLARQVSLQATALSVLDNLSDSLSRELDPESSLNGTLAECLDAAGLSVGAILLSDTTGKLAIRATVGSAATLSWEAHAGVLREAIARGGVLIPSPETKRDGLDLLVALGVASALVVPIVARDEALGVLLLASNRTDLGDAESETFVRVARSVSMQLGEALALSRMFTKLTASEKRLRAIMDGAYDCIFVLDADGRICDVNPSTERFLERPRAELMGKALHEFVHPPDRERAKEEFAASIQTGHFFVEARRFARPDGSVVIGDISASIVKAEGLIVVFGVMRDVTERVRTQEALRLSETRFTRLAESGIVGIAVADLFGHILEANDAYLTMLGYSHEDLAAGRLAWSDTTPSEWRARDAIAIAELGATGVARPWEKELSRKDGTRVPVLIGMAMLDHPKCLAVVSDLTDRKRAEKRLGATEEQLRQAQKMEAFGRLAGGVAHDFNNALSVILSYAQIIVADLKPGDPLRDDVEEIGKAGNRAAALTRQLLMFSRQNVIEPRVLDVNDVLSDMDKMLQRIVGEDVDVVALRAESLGRVRVDAGAIEQVIMNLVVNARDAMPTGGRLTVETANVTLDDDFTREHVGMTAGPHVMLAVSDTGTGMDPATQARIFEPYFTTKPKDKGTGLGLSTVFGIAQQSGGCIWVYSEPGNGTTFKVYLPRVDAEVDKRPSQAPPANLHGTETILLVEDDDPVRAVAMGILRRHGYQVLAARHAGEALLLCERHSGAIQLLVTDVVMPQMGGPELARRLEKERPEMKVLYMSGYTDDSIVRHGVLDATVAYLQKPLTIEGLARKVRAVLDSPEGAPSARAHGAMEDGEGPLPRYASAASGTFSLADSELGPPGKVSVATNPPAVRILPNQKK
jgi:PAS domain S-box-containing protein